MFKLGSWNSVVGLLALLAGCGADTPSAAPVPVVPPKPAIEISFSPAGVAPGNNMTVVLTQQFNPNDPTSFLRLQVDGLISFKDSIAASATIPGFIAHTATLPLRSGTVHAVASSITGTGGKAIIDTTVTIKDSLLPSVSMTWQLANARKATAVQPGDDLYFVLTGTDNVGIQFLSIQLTGSVTVGSSQEFGAHTPLTTTILEAPVSAATPVGGGIQVIAQAVDFSGNVSSTPAITIPVRDLIPPTVVAQISGAHPNGGFVGGDSVQVTLSVSDNFALNWFGVSIPGLNLRDSVSASSKSAQHQFTVLIPATAGGNFPLTAFATDKSGNRTEFVETVLAVGSRTRRAPVSLALGPIYDMAIDSRRGRVYATLPDSDRVESVDAATGLRLGHIAIAGQPAGIDFTSSGDSLVTALLTHGLVVADITTGDTASAGFSSTYPATHVRTAANGRFLVTTVNPCLGACPDVHDFDPRLRADVQTLGANMKTTLAATGNRQFIVNLDDGDCCPVQLGLYNASTDTFGGGGGTVSALFQGIAADFNGSHFLVGNRIYGPTIALVKQIHAPTATFRAVALSPDAAFAYVSTPSGVTKVRISDDTVVESFATDAEPKVMTLSVDGLTLAVATPGKLYIFDLW